MTLIEAAVFKTHDIIGRPISVAHHDSIYWLRSTYKKKPALISSYNWKDKHFLEGTISGLQHESPFIHINDSSKLLLHLHQDLCLVWDDLISTSTNDNDDNHTHIHFTLLRVCREDPPSTTLSAFVLGCFFHILPMLCDVRQAYLL